MKKWVDATQEFSEEERHYNNTYLEICEVYDEQMEVSLFSSSIKPYEIYFKYDIFYGIIYTDAENGLKLKDKVKQELEKEYNQNEKVTDEFIDYFSETYEVSLADDIFFNPEDLLKLFDF